jgi:hypothetical protein
MAIYHLLDLKKYVDEETRQQRREICNKCPRRNPKMDTCRMCGCFLKLKIKLATEECPERNWKKKIS